MTPEFTLAGLLLSSSWMAAVSWIVQLVHYPQFLYIDQRAWSRAHRQHRDRIGVLVVPPMMLQVATTILLFREGPWPGWFAWVSLVLLAGSVGWTGAVSGPLHIRLKSAKDMAQIQLLVYTNWVRTICWTAQAALAWWVMVLHG